MKENIPPFSNSNSNSNTLVLLNNWRVYVHKHFEISNVESTHECNINALVHNLNHIKSPLDTNELASWYRIIHDLNTYERPGVGKCIRNFYERSEKNTDQLSITIQILASLGIFKELRDFFSVIPDEYEIIDKIYSGIISSEIWFLYNNMLFGPYDENANNVNYFVKYIYTPDIIEKMVKNGMSKEDFVNKTMDLMNNLNLGVYHPFNKDTEELDFIISVLFVVENIKNSTIPNLFDKELISNSLKLETTINNIFKSKYPVQYEHYMMLKSLDLTIKPTDVAAHLNTESIQLESLLPEL